MTSKCRAVQWPDVARPHDVEFVVGQGGADFDEAGLRDRDLEILVLARLLTAEQIDRPPRDYPPRRRDVAQPLGDLARMPGVPRGIVGPDAARRQLVSHAERASGCAGCRPR